MNKQPKFKIDNAKLTRLVAKAQGGNQKALDEVVNMVSGYIYYYCLTLLGDEEKSKDAVQDILLTMLKKLDSLADPKAFLGWIKTITSNYCKTKLTRSKDNLSLDEGAWDFADENEQICPSKSAETSEVCGYVRKAVKALPQLLRESASAFTRERNDVLLQSNERKGNRRNHGVKRKHRQKPTSLGAQDDEKAPRAVRRSGSRFVRGTADVAGIFQPYRGRGNAEKYSHSLRYSVRRGKACLD